jgi:hypothetical protein
VVVTEAAEASIRPRRRPVASLPERQAQDDPGRPIRVAIDLGMAAFRQAGGADPAGGGGGTFGIGGMA